MGAGGAARGERRQRDADGVGIKAREKAEDVHFSHQLGQSEVR